MKSKIKLIVWRVLRWLYRDTDSANPRSVCVCVHTFDGYRRFWKPMIFYLEQSVGEKVSVFCASENISMSENYQSIKTGYGSYIKRLIRALRIIAKDYKYVLYLQEDMWLKSEICESNLKEWVQFMESHKLECLKLGWYSFFPSDRSSIESTTDLVSDGNPSYRWFGKHNYGLSHHCSLFRTNFLLSTAVFSYLFGRKKPLQHEMFVSKIIQKDLRTRSNEVGKINIAVWNNNPIVDYVHACEGGLLTEDGQKALRDDGITAAFEEGLEGEVFPEKQSVKL